ncbi:PH domain-containing protein [Zunongwangia sp. F363]|uniref:PH domain-containing protein n=1 Tax=Autumnicola tepida TaxID=3075595 RepID=A0ABU3CDC2_9FLAO|nr:PH domain-containing protein [Zunongwangia sp. F363]MDT0644278.1 PH domain-containing protein [Zunongwangia sp. F363]
MDSVDQKESFQNSIIALETLPRFQEVSYNPISRKLLSKHLIQISIWLLAVAAFCVFLFYNQQEDRLTAGFAIGAFVIFSFLYFNAWKMQKVYGYCLREKDIIYRRGYIVSKTTVISFNRIQHVSISRGVLDKIFKLSTLKIFTAGGSGSDISIPGLKPELARDLKEALVQKISDDEGGKF